LPGLARLFEALATPARPAPPGPVGEGSGGHLGRARGSGLCILGVVRFNEPMPADRSSAKRGPYSSGASSEAPTQFHERLRWLRKQRGLTQVEMAEFLGCEQTMISSWESGRTRPTAATLEALARFHGLSSKVIDSGDGFMDIAAAVLEKLRQDVQHSEDSLQLTLEPPLPGRIALVDRVTQKTVQEDASEAMNQILRALKKGREIWVVMR